MRTDRSGKIPIDSYGTIVKIDAAERKAGFTQKSVLKAKEYLQQTFPNLDRQGYLLSQQDKQIQDQLLDSVCTTDSFSSQNHLMNDLTNSQEGICLRCYVSHFILRACQERFMRFSLGGQLFQLRDLLSLVLNDDERFLPMSQDWESFIPYSFEILQEYLKLKPSSRKGLDRWTLMKIKHSDAIEQFLLECGVCTDSDWGILNATSYGQLERICREFHIFSPNAIQHLTESEIQRARAILQAFHEIYRGDRQKNHQYGRCQPPTKTQLHRMIEYLWMTYQIHITPQRLMDEIKAIASRLRDYRLVSHNSMVKCPSLDASDSTNGRNLYEGIPDKNSLNNLRSEDEEDLRNLFSKELIPCLDKAIDIGFCDVINSLSSRCANLADYIKPAFYCLYCQGMTQKETESRIKKITQSQISRHIKPLIPKHLQQVKLRIQEQLLQLILNKVKHWRIVENPQQLDYFSNLVSQIEVFVDNEIFSFINQESGDQQTGNIKTKQVNSLYFERVSVYLSKYKDV